MFNNISLTEDLFTIQLYLDKFKVIFTKKSSGNFSFQQKSFDISISKKNRYDFFTRYNIPIFNVLNPILQHDKNYIIATQPSSIEAYKPESQNSYADAVLVLKENLYGMITFADCIPIALLNTKTNACASIHLGSRSIIKNVICDLVNEWNNLLKEDSKNWFAIIGPSIYYMNYEVQDDFYQLIHDTNKSLLNFIHYKDKKLYFDNRAALFNQLKMLSINRIFSLDFNTYTDERFSSYRKDKPNHITQALLVGFTDNSYS